MVTLQKNRFTIEVECGTGAPENYVETMNDIVSILQFKDADISGSNYYYLLELLREMLPTREQAQALFDEIKEVEQAEQAKEKKAPRPKGLVVV